MSEISDPPFWKVKSLEELSASEWEALCDGCGRCCLNKLEDWDTGEIAWTNVACRLLDDDKCSCRQYETRQEVVPDCVGLTPETVRSLTWLPPTCAYRLVAEERDLYWWHYLVSGDRETVHQAGISVKGRTVSEEGMPLEEFEDHIVEWPEEEPA
nr:YcgN family cysteine cluster protein [Jiella sp. LLJ827]